MRNFFLIALVVVASCSSTKGKDHPNADPAMVLKDFGTWWNYHSKNILLAEDYTALDEKSVIISREDFLKSLITGKYIALKLKTSDAIVKYQLYPVTKETERDIVLQSQAFGREEYRYLKMQGTTVPNFNFTDLNGKSYTAENTKGKIVLLKCWFVQCTACVKEMPELNKLVARLSDRDDVVFLSLAYDKPEQLKNFLAKTSFNYATAAVEPEYFENKLKVQAYPTHVVVNRQGLIASVSTDYREMEIALDRELAK